MAGAGRPNAAGGEGSSREHPDRAVVPAQHSLPRSREGGSKRWHEGDIAAALAHTPRTRSFTAGPGTAARWSSAQQERDYRDRIRSGLGSLG